MGDSGTYRRIGLLDQVRERAARVRDELAAPERAGEVPPGTAVRVTRALPVAARHGLGVGSVVQTVAAPADWPVVPGSACVAGKSGDPVRLLRHEWEYA